MNDFECFATGAKLAAEIRRIVRGTDLRIATAFWTPKGSEALLGNRSLNDVKLLCDISLGATSPAALKALGAPDNEALRHHERLHSKIFISSEGMVVGSANVSLAALGTNDDEATQLEAGTIHRAGCAAWQQAIEWFDPLHENSDQIGPAELSRAEILYRPPSRGNQPPRKGSLLDLVAAAPWRFADVSFVVTGNNNTAKDIKAARRSAKKRGTTFSGIEIDQWPEAGMFTSWDNEVKRGWQRSFIEFWLGPRAVKVFGYRGEIFDDDNGSVFARRAWRSIQDNVGVALPTRKLIGTIDGAMARRLTPLNEGTLYRDGEELAAAIRTLS